VWDSVSLGQSGGLRAFAGTWRPDQHHGKSGMVEVCPIDGHVAMVEYERDSITEHERMVSAP
jgi:hypothetical protein